MARATVWVAVWSEVTVALAKVQEPSSMGRRPVGYTGESVRLRSVVMLCGPLSQAPGLGLSHFPQEAFLGTLKFRMVALPWVT